MSMSNDNVLSEYSKYIIFRYTLFTLIKVTLWRRLFLRVLAIIWPLAPLLKAQIQKVLMYYKTEEKVCQPLHRLLACARKYRLLH